MKSRDFCYWLQGYFEMRQPPNGAIDADQTRVIAAHLALVFKHEIDPAMGDATVQDALNVIHGPPAYNGGKPTMRC